ncbi:MAG TPA: hypothetical protein PKN92_10290 [Candidatus Hydrogenedentes bacterium]|nr:hypothetical protein [Candidatus Hydrogenedentota bacterium]
MFDFHSHILPGIDDGSQSVKESLNLLRESARQGVTAMAATSHFYASEYSPKEFLAKRNAAWKQLEPYLEAGMPEIKLGAEVHYFEGIAQSEDVCMLRIEGTSLLLVEMPMSWWTSRMVDALLDLNSRPDTTVLLAHIERYLSMQDRKTWKLLRSEGVKMQVNASFFWNPRTRRKALGMLKKKEIHALGSDCHNMENRPPRLADAKREISARLGKEALIWLRRQERCLLAPVEWETSEFRSEL